MHLRNFHFLRLVQFEQTQKKVWESRNRVKSIKAHFCSVLFCSHAGKSFFEPQGKATEGEWVVAWLCEPLALARRPAPRAIPKASDVSLQGSFCHASPRSHLSLSHTHTHTRIRTSTRSFAHWRMRPTAHGTIRASSILVVCSWPPPSVCTAIPCHICVVRGRPSGHFCPLVKKGTWVWSEQFQVYLTEHGSRKREGGFGREVRGSGDVDERVRSKSKQDFDHSHAP